MRAGVPPWGAGLSSKEDRVSTLPCEDVKMRVTTVLAVLSLVLILSGCGPVASQNSMFKDNYPERPSTLIEIIHFKREPRVGRSIKLELDALATTTLIRYIAQTRRPS